MKRVDRITQVVIAYCVLHNVCLEQLDNIDDNSDTLDSSTERVKIAKDDQTCHLLPGRQDSTNVT